MSVQIASKSRGVRTIVEHLGSAHNDAELTALVSIGKEKILAGQLAFDLDALSRGPVVAAPTVAGSRSRLLWEVLEDAYQRLGFEAVGSQAFKKLVLARVIEPSSKADTIRVLSEVGVAPVPLRTIWRTLARCVAHDWRTQLAEAAYAHASRAGALTLVLYDVTTLYFEAESEDRLRKVGLSKERRVDPQILVGLLVDKSGFPLQFDYFTGNTAETTTLIPMLDAFRHRHEVEDLVVAADAGMLSASNLNALEEAGYRFIVGSRTSSAPYDLAEHVARHGNYLPDGATVETTRTMGAGAAARTRRVVWQYSFKRDKRDNLTLNKQIERAEAIADGRRPARKDRFVKLAGERPTVDWARIEKVRTWLGLKGYVTNIPKSVLDGPRVVAAYHDLFNVEASFRMAKTDLRARPMFHHEEDSIAAHLTVVFAALAVSRHLQAASGVSIRKLVRTLKPLRDVTIQIGDQHLTATTPPSPEAAEMLSRINSQRGH